MSQSQQIKNYWMEQLEDVNRDNPGNNWVANKKRLHESRGNKVPRITGSGHVYRSYQTSDKETKVEYRLYVTFFIKKGELFYHEEEERTHQAVFYQGKLIEDKVIEGPRETEQVPTIEAIATEDVMARGFEYDRRAAVQYAERWWNNYNPEYEKFEVDCTNFISQCLRAGGAPMRGIPNKGNGWWYQNNDWSYSWSVAHSMRWYLSGSNQGLKGKELEDPSELVPGDVICYDFEGDGKWDHTTIVVEKDTDGMPLVNAHTDNSRHRYWSYEDSTAWTPDIQYKFFRIGD